MKKKGFIAIDLIFVAVIVIFLVAYAFKTNIDIRSNINTAKILAQNYIDLVEEEGYITPAIKAKTAKDLGDLFSEIEIDGTLEPVKKGEEVHLILTVANKNLRGGYIAKETIVVSGVAK